MKRLIISILCLLAVSGFLARCAGIEYSLCNLHGREKSSFSSLSPHDFNGIFGGKLGSLSSLVVNVVKVYNDKFYVRTLIDEREVKCIIFPQSEPPAMPSMGDNLKITFFEQIVQRGASEDVYSHLHQSAVRKKHDPPGGDGSLRFEFQFNVLDITKLP